MLRPSKAAPAGTCRPGPSEAAASHEVEPVDAPASLKSAARKHFGFMPSIIENSVQTLPDPN